MKQVWIPKIGGPSVLELREAPDPEPKADEVRIRVRACGVNFADVLARMGLYPDSPKLPAVVGYEVAGVVDQLGDSVTELAVGQRVLAMTRFGGYTDTRCVPASMVSALPDTLSFEQGAAIPVQYLTAWVMLVYLGNVKAGDRVLIHAAAGGVGQAAVQICKYKGAEMFGTASRSKHARLKEIGVHHTIDYRTQDFEAEVMRLTDGHGVAIVLDAVGGTSFTKSYRCLDHLGRLYVFGGSSFAPGEKRKIVHAALNMMKMPKYRPFEMMDQNRGVHGVNLGHLWHKADLLKSLLNDIVALAADGTFQVTISETFPLERAREAHAYIQARRNFGKVLLTSEHDA